VAARGLQTPFKCLLRTDLISVETARALKKAGCESVWVGAESGSQKVLNAMEKGATVEDTYSAARILKETGIQVGFFLQFVYPGEEWADIEQTLQMICHCKPDDIGISVAYPLPGTDFFETVREELGALQNWVDSNDLASHDTCRVPGSPRSGRIEAGADPAPSRSGAGGGTAPPEETPREDALARIIHKFS